MDKLEKYRNYVIRIIDKYGNYRPSCGDIEIQKICDEKNDHYQVMSVGWHNSKRVYGCSLHIDIKNNKIWIQHNGTERSIADELTELGVQKEDIVLGFHTPYMRQFTDYATN
ncbi:MAG: XisI protein [Desulfobacterales bacterium]|nr:XisI protein [Desulfobacterales bacterium]